MCDLSLSYLFQIYTATPLVFTHMYRVFISVLIKYLEWRCCEIELFRCTLPFEILEQGGQTGQRDLEPPNGPLKGTCYQLKYCKKILKQRQVKKKKIK